ncbi:hypothetical protein Ancab_037282, partial [Ancistrocladus abbreviatus]
IEVPLTEVAPKLGRLEIACLRTHLDSLRFQNWRSQQKVRGVVEAYIVCDDPVEEIQGRDRELRLGLETLPVVQIKGYWRIVDEDYMDSLLRMLMLLHNGFINEYSRGID